MGNQLFMNEISNLYNKGDLVPFVGTGLSAPFDIPQWGDLIVKYATALDTLTPSSIIEVIRYDIENYDYWNALKNIKKYGKRIDKDVQDYICNKINACVKKADYTINNNFVDIANMDFNIYLTTNYDRLIEHYISSDCISLNLYDFNDSTHEIFNEERKKVFHLHGNINQPESIVITEEKYKELYDSEKYKMLFSLLTGSKTFLFMGFSFNDIFIQKLMFDINKYFKTKHYILLNSPTEDQVRKLKEKHNLEVIKYDTTGSSHISEVRKILEQLSQDSDKQSINDAVDKTMGILLETLPDSKIKKDLEETLFCRKLRLEEIEENLIDLSKDYFWGAEQFIRWLGRSKINRRDDVVSFILDNCYSKYKELIGQVFMAYSDSNTFLNAVHEALKDIDLSKVEAIIQKSHMPAEFSRKGFIHVLANNTNDKDKEVWWGGKRFE